MCSRFSPVQEDGREYTFEILIMRSGDRAAPEIRHQNRIVPKSSDRARGFLRADFFRIPEVITAW